MIQNPVRKTYVAPALKVYGDARALTQTKTNSVNANPDTTVCSTTTCKT
ncbi:MAG TPA: hypothetical protein VF771_21990 [Longimicrobiaceae bacterium]